MAPLVIADAGWAQAVAPPPEVAESAVREFYAGRTVRLIVGFAPGGVFDITARRLAPHFAKYLPGSPRIVVQNMPGAGSMKAVEWAIEQAPRDGSTMVSISSTAIMQSVLAEAGGFVERLSWLGSVESSTRICVVYSAAGVTDLASVRARGLILGASTAGSPTAEYAALMRSLFDGVRVVMGYPGTHDLALAMERQEIQGVCGTSLEGVSLERPDWLDSGRLSVLMRFSRKALPASVGSPPSFLDLAGEDVRAAAELIVSQEDLARPYATPAPAPAERLAALRTAFDFAVAAPEFRAEMERSGVTLSPLSGAAVEAVVSRLAGADAAVKRQARAMLSR